MVAELNSGTLKTLLTTLIHHVKTTEERSTTLERIRRQEQITIGQHGELLLFSNLLQSKTSGTPNMKITTLMRSFLDDARLSKATNMRGRSLIDRVNSGTRIVNSRSSNITILLLRFLRGLGGLDLGNGIRNDHKLINGRGVKITNGDRDSRSTLARATERLIQVLVSTLFKLKGTGRIRGLNNTLRHLLLKMTAIRAGALTCLLTSLVSQIRKNREVLRSRHSVIATGILRLFLNRLRSEAATVTGITTLGLSQERQSGTRSNRNNRKLAKTKLASSTRNLTTVRHMKSAISDTGSTVLNIRVRL